MAVSLDGLAWTGAGIFRVPVGTAKHAGGPAMPRGLAPLAGDGMQPAFTLRLQNRLLELDRVAEAVEAFGEAHGLSPKLRFQIRLVLDELVTNIISYGYPDGGEHGIEVAMRQDGGRLLFVLTDDARPFDPLCARAPDLESEAEQRRIGGLGIHLARVIMDRAAYERVGNLNRLILEKDLD